MVFNVKNRWQAFGIHLFISILIFLVLLSIIIFVWYPGIFIQVGGYQGIQIVAGVDLILGPLLTLTVFNLKKKSLKMDLSIIALIQLAALSAGVWLVYNERPVFQLLSHDGIHIITAADIKIADIYDIDYDKFDTDFPKLAYMDLPQDKGAIQVMNMATGMTENLPLQLRLDLYRNINSNDAFQWLLEGGERNQKDSCTWLPILTTHISGEACFSTTAGIVAISKTP